MLTGRIIGFYADEKLSKALDRYAGESGKTLSQTVKETLQSKLSSKELTVAVLKEDEWVVGKYLLEELPKALKNYKEKLTGKYEEVKVKIYLK
jgi:hypothetical protein